jgi:hypothetical protein
MAKGEEILECSCTCTQFIVLSHVTNLEIIPVKPKMVKCANCGACWQYHEEAELGKKWEKSSV